MTEDLFDTIAKLEQRADGLVTKAKAQAKEMRAEVDRKLKALADELEKDYGLSRQKIETELAGKREQLLQACETRLRESLAKLDDVRQKKVKPLVEHVIKAFLEETHGH